MDSLKGDGEGFRAATGRHTGTHSILQPCDNSACSYRTLHCAVQPWLDWIWITSVLYHTPCWCFRLDNTGENLLTAQREAAFMVKGSCCLKDRILDPVGKFIPSHSILTISFPKCAVHMARSFQNDSLIWSFCCVRGCRWKTLSFACWGEVDFGLPSNQLCCLLNVFQRSWPTVPHRLPFQPRENIWSRVTRFCALVTAWGTFPASFACKWFFSHTFTLVRVREWPPSPSSSQLCCLL